MDANNSVVTLCAAGMAAEGEGRGADAKSLFEQAWEESRDDYEACIAAHYLARHQPTAELELEWNARALERAATVGDERVRAFYPSLYLNYGHSLERLGRSAEACGYYNLAAERLADLPAGSYANLVRTGVTAGQNRTCPVGNTANAPTA